MEAEIDRLGAKFALLFDRHLEYRRSAFTAHRLPGVYNAIEVVRARIQALDAARKLAA